MYKSVTQEGILKIPEKIIRGIPLIYYFSRNFIKLFNIFENDFKSLKIIFKNKKIRILDIGASDGISALYFIRNLNPIKLDI